MLRRNSLAHLRTIGDLREGARRRLPRAVFDFIDGAAEDELTAHRNRSDYQSIEFAPRGLIDVSKRDLTTSILGKPAAMPLMIAPTGLAALACPTADTALARAAAGAGIPVIVSMCASARLERIAAAAPNSRRWFQVYPFKDHGLVRSVLARAQA